MGPVTAHFEFSGAFWVLAVVLVLGSLAIVYRRELRTMFDRIEAAQVKSRSTS